MSTLRVAPQEVHVWEIPLQEVSQGCLEHLCKRCEGNLGFVASESIVTLFPLTSSDKIVNMVSEVVQTHFPNTIPRRKVMEMDR